MVQTTVEELRYSEPSSVEKIRATGLIADIWFLHGAVAREDYTVVEY